MERRKFLKVAAALPVLGLLPACDDDNEYYRHYEISPSVPQTYIESDLMGVKIKLAVLGSDSNPTTRLKYGEPFSIYYSATCNTSDYNVEFDDLSPLIGMGRVYTSAGEYVGIANGCPSYQFTVSIGLGDIYGSFHYQNYPWSIEGRRDTNPPLERGDYYIQYVFEYKMWKSWEWEEADFVFKVSCKINFTVE